MLMPPPEEKQEEDKNKWEPKLVLIDFGLSNTAESNEGQCLATIESSWNAWPQTRLFRTITTTTPSPLERALLQGVVPADAGVGSECLPGDYGFDPLNVATKDYFHQVQTFLLKFLNWGGSDDDEEEEEDEMEEAIIADVAAAMPKRDFVGNNDQGARPPALILRDYREAEIRHGRLAMLADLFWPLQEILDRMFLPETFGSTTVIYV
eukprot:scaffold2553_cov32-Attheya_sp.AAC.4